MQLDYARQTGAADLAVLQASHLVQFGVGSGQTTTQTLVRMGAGEVTAVDFDVVEPRNVTSQGYHYEDARLRIPKVEALAQECRAINPEVRIHALQRDVTTISDAEVRRIFTPNSVLVVSTDNHTAQARGALMGLVLGIPVVLASLYREGRAGEVIFTLPGYSKACYRCITATRYDHVARRKGSGTGNAGGSLPFAAHFVDALVGHLIIALMHKSRGDDTNRFARWIDQLGQRNFIQVRMDPDYRLGNEDIFGAALGRGDQVFAFDSIWQSGLPEVKPNCPDCHGLGATATNRCNESTELEQWPCGCLIQKGLVHACHLAATSIG